MTYYKRITVKVGSNVLTRADGTLDVTRMSAIVDQIAAVRRAGIEVVLISSGAVACGRSELDSAVSPRLDSVSRRQLFSAVGQVKLINRYFDLFGGYGIPVGQVLTMKESFSTRAHYLNQRNCMMVMLASGVLPIVNENDTVSVTELMFTDNDELSGLVAAMTDCDALIILSNIDGIYNGDPKSAESEVIRRVAPGESLERYISAEKSGFGRGGMSTKYRIARKVADEGIEVIIANGTRDGILTDLILADRSTVCTSFSPAPVQQSSLKRWISHSDGFAKGTIKLNADAAAAITGPRAASVLMVGVTDVEGDFERDDLVRVSAPDGRIIGIGRSAYSAGEARHRIGQRDCRPIVHYDYLCLE